LRSLRTVGICVCLLVLGVRRPAAAGETLSDKWGEYPADYVDVNPLLVSLGP